MQSAWSGALHINKAQARALVAELAAAELLHVPESDGGPVTVTDTGQRVYRVIRAEVGEVTQRLWGDLPAEDLATAGRVLSTVLTRARAELSSGVRRRDLP